MASNKKLEKKISEMEKELEKLRKENAKLKGKAVADTAVEPDEELKIGPSEDKDESIVGEMLRSFGFRKVGKDVDQQESLDKEIDETRVKREKFELDMDTRVRAIAINDINTWAGRRNLDKVEVANLHRKVAKMHPDDIVSLIKDLKAGRIGNIATSYNVTPGNYYDFGPLEALPAAR